VKKEGWPEFPLLWLEKRNTSSLQALASHLHEKTQGLRKHSGFRGQPSEMENQIIQHLIDLDQQVLVLTDVVQALLQIIDDQRTSQRAKRALRWIWEKAKRCLHKLRENTIYQIVAAVSVLVSVITLLLYLLHVFRR
jgi:hypothetical protein